jgi:hypothetical protein
MEHEEFAASTPANPVVWGVRGPARAVRAVWGGSGLACYGLACLLALAPALALGVWAAMQARYGALFWVVLAALAFLMGRPRLNLMDGLPWILCGLAGVVVAIFAGLLHLLGGAAVVATWILAGAVRGTTMVYLEDRLRRSKDAFERLRAAGQLIFIERRRGGG